MSSVYQLHTSFGISMKTRSYSEKLIRDIIQFKQTGILPVTMVSKPSQYRFKQKYGGEDYTVKNGKLYRDGKEIIPVEKQVELIEEKWTKSDYKHPNPLSFYKRLGFDYDGISKSLVNNVLNQKTVVQKFAKAKRREVTPIHSKRPLQMFQLDFVDLKNWNHANLGTKYLLNVIDHFSKYAWSFPVKDRTAKLQVANLRPLFELYRPDILKGDQEFRAERNFPLRDLCEQMGIKLIHSNSYSPASNGCIERFNQTLKRKITSLTREYSDNTFIDALEGLVDGYNKTPHSSHGYAPITVLNRRNDDDFIQHVFDKAEKYRRKIYRGSTQPTNIPAGTVVRLATRSYAEERKKRKLKKMGYDQNFKGLDTIKIHFKPRRPYRNHEYLLEGQNRKVYRSDFLVVPSRTSIDDPQPPERPEFKPGFAGRTPQTKKRKIRE